MRWLAIAVALGACGCLPEERELKGSYGWMWMGDFDGPATPLSRSLKAFAMPIEGGWQVMAARDGATTCGAATDDATSRMVIEISVPVLEMPNMTFPITETFDPSVVSASVSIDGRQTTAGAFLLSNGGDPLEGRFDGAVFQDATVSGRFTAVRCW